MVGQSLSTTVEVYDPKLKPIGSIDIGGSRWKKVNYRRLEKVSKNPRELESLQKSFSEIIGVEAVSGSLFVVAYRNLSGAPYTFQCFEAKTGSAVGQPYDTAYTLAGAYGTQLFLKDPNAEAMILIPTRVQR